MIQFLKKHQKQLSMGLAISVLVLCYFQRKEINKLKEQLNIQTKIVDDTTTVEIINQEIDADTLFLKK